MKLNFKDFIIDPSNNMPSIKPVRVGDHHGQADIRCHPDPSYRVMPVALIDRGNTTYLLTKDVAEQLYSSEYYSAAIVTALQANSVFLWRINIDNRDPKYIDNVMIKQAITELIRVTDTYAVQPTAIQPPANWSSLPPFANMVEDAFRGRVITSFTDPTLWT
jgi:hypothetical protein